MSRFRDELKVGPVLGWIIAFTVFASVALLLFSVAIPSDRETRNWPVWGAALFSVGISSVLVVLILLVGYVNGDAKRRGMNRALWTLIAIFVPNGIGIILYFFLREPLMQTCSQCRAQVRSKLPFCPHCGMSLGPSCPACRRPVEPGWRSCAYCGAALSSASTAPLPAVNR
ncbi:MAG: zinc ribbon domain-containing protein [Actinomycetota bacterium]